MSQEALEKAGHCSPTWVVLRSLQKVYGSKRIPGYTIIDGPPFFESVVREKLTDSVGSDPGQEGSSPTQGEDDSTIFWEDDQGPVVMVWDDMLDGEQERAKKIIGGENDWIICRVKPPRG